MRPVTLRKPLSSLHSTHNLREYYDLLRIQAGLPARSPVPPALKFLHQPRKPSTAATAIASKPPTPRPAPAAGAVRAKAGGAPRPRSYPGVGSLKFTVIGGPSRTEPTGGCPMTEPTDEEFLDLDGPVSAGCVTWWNAASVEERCFYMGRAGSLDPRKAFTVYQADAARWAEDQAAERRTYQNIVAKARAAKAAAAGAASRVGMNGAGTPH